MKKKLQAPFTKRIQSCHHVIYIRTVNSQLLHIYTCYIWFIDSWSTNRQMFQAFLMDLRHSKPFIYIFVKSKRNKNIDGNNFCKEVYKKLWKKRTLGTSDTWLISRLSKRPSNSAHYIEDCQIFTVLINILCLSCNLMRLT